MFAFHTGPLDEYNYKVFGKLLPDIELRSRLSYLETKNSIETRHYAYLKMIIDSEEYCAKTFPGEEGSQRFKDMLLSKFAPLIKNNDDNLPEILAEIALYFRAKMQYQKKQIGPTQTYDPIDIIFSNALN